MPTDRTPPFHPQSPDDIPDRDRLARLSGLEFLRESLAGRMPASAIAGLINAELTGAAPGRVTFHATPEFAHTNPVGAVHGGWYGTLLDSAMGCAVMTTVPRGRWYTTLEYKINITRALPLGVAVIAEGIVDHAGRSTATAHGTIKAVQDGKLYATGTTTCIMLDL
jgi:uncharacterized protein (TIGR00369 family)